MPTAKPRIAITLEPEHYEVLSRLAELQGRPMSRIVAELVGETAPMLAKVVATIEVAQRAQEGVKAKLRKAIDQAEATILPHAQLVLEQYDIFGAELGALADQIEASKGRAAVGTGASAPGRAAARQSPRPVITGATNPANKRKTANKATKGAAKGQGRRARK